MILSSSRAAILQRAAKIIKVSATSYQAEGIRIMRVVSEQEKAVSLISLTEDDLDERSYSFVQGTLRRMHEGNHLDKMSEKQTKWFHDLYEKHFG